MGIFSILRQNARHGSRTLKPDDLPPHPQEFRGLIQQDSTLCTGCRNCSYICSPKAITFSDDGDTALHWEYQAAQCTFCSLCVMYCPTQALSDDRPLPNASDDQDNTLFVNTIPYSPCTSCGTPMVPIPEKAALRFFGGDADKAENLRLMCPECRRRAASTKIRDAFIKDGKEV